MCSVRRTMAAVAVLGLVATCAARPVRAQAVTLDLLLGQAGSYVKDFVDKFSNVVSEEKYSQDWTSDRMPTAPTSARGGTAASIAAGASMARHRETRSDFLLVKPTPQSDWMPFRDVFEVDGSAVRDREQRLERLFLKPTAGAVSRAQAIANESSRYNLGNMERTINNPVLALAFLQPEHQARFSFKLGKRDKGVGPNVWTLEYKEVVTPTLITGRFGRSMPSHGKFWIDAETGRVERVELTLNDSSVTAKLTTFFKYDPRFTISVPIELREQYSLSTNTKVSGVATYGRFRRFGVTAEETIETPPPATDPSKASPPPTGPPRP